MQQYIIKEIIGFEPKHIFECGQCFRWKLEGDGSYTNVIQGHVFNIKKEGKSAIINSDVPDPEKFMTKYLDLETDYSKIKQYLSSKGEKMQEAIKFGYGMRILRQEHWECLVSFIISANNFIPRIMKAVERLSEMLGEEIQFNEKAYYSFPTAEIFDKTPEDKLKLSGIGFRSKYIKSAARMVVSGEFDLDAIEKMDTVTARNELMRIPGVGPKIADCVMLYSYGKGDSFPTDVWIKRVVEELYLHREASLKDIQEFAKKEFGEMAGMAQQYLFYYARENKIGK